jgi:hypothetical protein
MLLLLLLLRPVHAQGRHGHFRNLRILDNLLNVSSDG